MMGDDEYSYMYGDPVPKTDAELRTEIADLRERVPQAPRPDVSRIREFLVVQSMPFFEGDQVDGLIEYCRKLEGYILGE